CVPTSFCADKSARNICLWCSSSSTTDVFYAATIPNEKTKVRPSSSRAKRTPTGWKCSATSVSQPTKPTRRRQPSTCLRAGSLKVRRVTQNPGVLNQAVFHSGPSPQSHKLQRVVTRTGTTVKNVCNTPPSFSQWSGWYRCYPNTPILEPRPNCSHPPKITQ